jgi:hypothetical protein
LRVIAQPGTTKESVMSRPAIRRAAAAAAAVLAALFTVLTATPAVAAPAASTSASQITLTAAGHAHAVRLGNLATQPEICTNGNYCLNAYGGGPSVRAYRPGATNENFIPDLIDRCSGGYHVTSTCPFTVGLGNNALHKGDLILQLLDNANGGCVGGTSTAALTECNFEGTGTGGGPGTVFVAAPEGGGLYTIINVRASNSLNTYGHVAVLNTNGPNGAAVVVNDSGASWFWTSTTCCL